MVWLDMFNGLGHESLDGFVTREINTGAEHIACNVQVHTLVKTRPSLLVHNRLGCLPARSARFLLHDGLFPMLRDGSM